jgi:hypothetical protein
MADASTGELKQTCYWLRCGRSKLTNTQALQQAQLVISGRLPPRGRRHRASIAHSSQSRALRMIRGVP